MALWEGNTDTWLFVNQQRVIGVSLIQTMYGSFYVGFGNRLLLPHEYNYPLCVLSSEDTAINYASTSGSRMYIANSQIRSYVKWDNSWVANPTIVPTQANTGNQIQIHYPVGVNRGITPLYIDYMQLDGVYYAPATISASESTITIGTVVYLIVENVNRHDWTNFMAIEEA